MGAASSKTSTKSDSTKNSASNESRPLTTGEEVLGIVLDAVVLYGIVVTSKYLYKSLKPMMDEFWQSDSGRSKLQNRLTRSGRPMFRTTYYEEVIAGDIVDPQDIEVSFEDIGGLEQQKRDIYDLVVLPLRCPQFFSSRGKLLSVPKGILLYGKPGTGKTMLAKAIARESGAFFIDLKISTIMSKWFGESQKLVRAAFSLARKLAPCIIFIDEVDSFMGKRGGVSDPTFASMKTEFLALWDGFTELSASDGGFGVIVLGATNRPGDVDPAFLRRMPRSFEIGLPSAPQREKILGLHLRNEALEEGFDLRRLGFETEHYSGSDLKELCRAALMIPLREHLEAIRIASLEAAKAQQENQCVDEAADATSEEQGVISVTPEMRPLTMADFAEARKMVQPTGAAAYAYEASQNERRRGGVPTEMPMDMEMFAAIMAAGLQQMMQFNQRQPPRG